MAQNKLQRFAELKTFSNVLEYPKNMQGQWSSFFNNNHPITLELACGKGEYAVGLGRLYPNNNFIGMDIKGNRMWVGARKALQESLSNVAFIRSQVERITEYFAAGEVADIWITFPDPQLRTGKAKKRLTHPRFLQLYKSFLSSTGSINLKTDSPDLYNFTLQVIDIYGFTCIQQLDDVYAQENLSADLQIKTHYEQLDIAQSNRIHYIRFLLDQPFTAEKEAQLKQQLTNE